VIRYAGPSAGSGTDLLPATDPGSHEALLGRRATGRRRFATVVPPEERERRSALRDYERIQDILARMPVEEYVPAADAGTLPAARHDLLRRHGYTDERIREAYEANVARSRAPAPQVEATRRSVTAAAAGPPTLVATAEAVPLAAGDLRALTGGAWLGRTAGYALRNVEGDWWLFRRVDDLLASGGRQERWVNTGYCARDGRWWWWDGKQGRLVPTNYRAPQPGRRPAYATFAATRPPGGECRCSRPGQCPTCGTPGRPPRAAERPRAPRTGAPPSSTTGAGSGRGSRAGRR
jgi:hypothetical protein